MNTYRASGFGGIPTVIKNLIIINVLFLIATFALGTRMNIDLISLFGLHFPLSENFRIWQPLTHMFMHGGVWHIFFNMLVLWMFGAPIEQSWGSKRFLIYYFVAGFGAAFTHEFVNYLEIRPALLAINEFLNNPGADTLTPLARVIGDPSLAFGNSDPAYISQQVQRFYEIKLNLLNMPPAVGASGAVYGVLLAFGMMYPNQQVMFIFPPIPIKAKYLVIGLAVIALISTKTDTSSNIAHAAHLGGMIFGYLLIRIWNKQANKPQIFH